MKLNSKFINVLMFTAGAAIGSVVTWKVVKTKYERIAQEEIDSVKEAFAEYFVDKDDTSADEVSEEDDEERPSISSRQINWEDYEDLDEDDEDDEAEEDEYQADEADREEYARLTSYYNNEKGGPEDMDKHVGRAPYVISPDDFASLDDWKTVSLTYYADDILEDEKYNIINNRNELIGHKALTTFGEYEEDSVFVRNERLKTDFEILKDYRTYDEARSIGPNRVDDE